MVNFGSFGKLAQSAAQQFNQANGSDNADSNKNNNNDSANGQEQVPVGDSKPMASGANGSDGWAGVGRSARTAFNDAEKARSEGKSLDYSELGGVAKEAATTYNAVGSDKDLTSIGKQFAGGMFGKGGAGAPGAVGASAGSTMDSAAVTAEGEAAAAPTAPAAGADASKLETQPGEQTPVA